VSSQDDAVEVDRDAVPFQLLDRIQAPAGQGSRSVEIYLVSPNGLVALGRPLTTTPTPANALRELTRPVSGSDADLGLVTAVPSDSARLRSVRNGLATVAIDRELVAADDVPVEAVGQIVLTLTQFPNVSRVEFVVDDDRIEVPTGEGALTRDPVTRAEYRSLLVSG
jgi:spore germination protein GerM